jgi:hypothetical protein
MGKVNSCKFSVFSFEFRRKEKAYTEVTESAEFAEKRRRSVAVERRSRPLQDEGGAPSSWMAIKAWVAEGLD